MSKIVLILNPLKTTGRVQQLKSIALVAGVTLFAGCQINKPVPVENIQPGYGYGYQQQPRAQVYQPGYDSRSYPRPHPSSINNSPYAGSEPYARQESNTSPATWQPIAITPLDMAVEPPEPTQPLNSYNSYSDQSKSYPLRAVANTSGYGQEGFHMVQRGESLYGIARSYGLNVTDLAAFNQMVPPYEIYPNQKIYLNAQGSGGQAVNNRPLQGMSAYSTPAAIKPMSQPAVPTGDIQWGWPAQGSLIGEYVAGQTNGIEISGQPGYTIRASADGTVLYSGNEVTGYGELIIIDHGQGFMSTYAHNRQLLVKQGDQVRRGDKIAEMGSSEADQTKLHFEIRKGEKPVDPLAYLPRR